MVTLYRVTALVISCIISRYLGGDAIACIAGRSIAIHRCIGASCQAYDLHIYSSVFATHAAI